MRPARVLLPCLLLGAGLAEPGEMRGLWVVRTALTSPQAVDQAVDSAAQAGLTDLFVQVRGRGDAFYQSRLVPRSPLLARQPADFDPFARLIERARGRGIAVHAWVNTLLTGHFGQPRPAVLEEHPEWIMVPKGAASAALKAAPNALPWLVQKRRQDGDAEGYYLSPSAPGVAEHLEAVVREIVEGYPVSGLHLDFVRYPGPDFDYSRSALEGFQRWRRGGGDLLTLPAAQPAAWADYRRDVLTALVQRLARAAREARPGLAVSAAVVPDEAQALSQKFQAWPAWLSGGVLDAACPMTYTPETRLFRAQLERARELSGPRPVWAGIGAYRLPLAGVVERVQVAREAGASGVLLFSHESLQGDDWRRLREAVFASRTARSATSAPAHGRR